MKDDGFPLWPCRIPSPAHATRPVSHVPEKVLDQPYNAAFQSDDDGMGAVGGV